jgi:chemotaxis protein histidine kinase CheA
MIATPAVLTLLQITAGGCAYLVYPHDVDWMCAHDPALAPARDPQGQPLHIADLGTLLGNGPTRAATAHQLGVRLRRRSVALIVDRVDDLTELPFHPLTRLIADRLDRGWVRGAALHHDRPVIVLDLRQLAMDALQHM